VARQTADKLQRRIAEAARTGEAQHELAAERTRQLMERLEDAIAAAEHRLAMLDDDVVRPGRHGRG
jgi:hypothetical protein